MNSQERVAFQQVRQHVGSVSIADRFLKGECVYHYRKIAEPVEYHTVKEFKGETVHWRDAEHDGQWVRTDDGFVVKAKRVTLIYEKLTRQIRVRKRVSFMIGQRYAHGKTPYLFQEVVTKNGYDHGLRPWWRVTHEMEPGIVTTFAFLVIGGVFDLKKHRYNAYQYEFLRQISLKFFGKETEWRRVRTFFNHDEVRKMIQKAIDNELTKREIDVSKVFDLLNQAEVMALTHVDKMGNVGNPAALIAVIDRYAGLVGMQMRKTAEKTPPPNTPEAGSLPGASTTFQGIIDAEEVSPVEVTSDPS